MLISASPPGGFAVSPGMRELRWEIPAGIFSPSQPADLHRHPSPRGAGISRQLLWGEPSEIRTPSAKALGLFGFCILGNKTEAGIFPHVQVERGKPRLEELEKDFSRG